MGNKPAMSPSASPGAGPRRHRTSKVRPSIRSLLNTLATAADPAMVTSRCPISLPSMPNRMTLSIPESTAISPRLVEITGPPRDFRKATWIPLLPGLRECSKLQSPGVEIEQIVEPRQKCLAQYALNIGCQLVHRLHPGKQKGLLVCLWDPRATSAPSRPIPD